MVDFVQKVVRRPKGLGNIILIISFDRPEQRVYNHVFRRHFLVKSWQFFNYNNPDFEFHKKNAWFPSKLQVTMPV